MDTEKKDVEKEQDAEYDKAWDEADKAEEKETPPETTETTTDDAAPVAPEAAAAKPEESPAEKPLEGVDKALRDTKAYATKLAQDNAKLREALAAKKSAEDIALAKANQEKAEADLKGHLDEAYKDYPELKGALDTITGELKTVKEKLTAKEQADAARDAALEQQNTIKATFEANVKPEVLKVHSDFDAIVGDPKGDFFAWAERGSTALKAAVFNSMDPSDIIWAVGEYKKARSTGGIDKLRKEEEARKQNNLNLAHGLHGSSSKIPSASKTENNEDPDAMWERAGKLLEKQGIK